MDSSEALLGLGIGMIFLVVFAIALLPQIFYLLTLHRTFEQVSVENRLMPSGQVWLTLIPIFGTIWQFIIVQRMADSLQKEFALRGVKTKEVRPGYNIGLAYCILSVSAIIPFAGVLASFAGLVCWIIYWINIADYKNLLIRNPLIKVTHQV
jgi:hypothetical protein